MFYPSRLARLALSFFVSLLLVWKVCTILLLERRLSLAVTSVNSPTLCLCRPHLIPLTYALDLPSVYVTFCVILILSWIVDFFNWFERTTGFLFQNLLGRCRKIVASWHHSHNFHRFFLLCFGSRKGRRFTNRVLLMKFVFQGHIAFMITIYVH